MCTNDLCFERNNKYHIFFYLKVIIFTAVKNRHIFIHGCVIVMGFIRGNKHDFPFINIRKVPQEA